MHPSETVALRSEFDVKSLLHQANVNEDNLLSETQVLHFSSNFMPEQDKVVLIELDSTLQNYLKEGQRAVLRGDPEDNAVLCTNNKTYQVRGAVTSNSMLLVPGLEISSEDKGKRNLIFREVSSLHHAYLEVVPCTPQFHKLRRFLEECPYQGSEDEIDKDHRYSTSELLDRIQCSEEELEAGLKSLGAYHIYGFWYLLEFDYHFKIVSHITNMVQKQKWPLDNIPYDKALQELSKLESRTVMAQCLDYYLHPMHSETEDGDSLHALIGDKVCRLFGEMIIRSITAMDYEEFIDMWAKGVPEGLNINLKQMNGLLLVDKSTSPQRVTYFPSAELPLDIKSRFETLFHVQEKWTYDDIRPFIDDLADSKNTVSTMLMKHARASTVDGIKYYSGRYAK